MTQITWKRNDKGTLTPYYRAEFGQPWVPCTLHPLAQNQGYGLLGMNLGMSVWEKLRQQGATVIQSEDISR